MATSEVQFADRHKKPVEAHTEGGQVVSNGIDWSDYARMSTVSRNKPWERRRPVPSFAFSDELLRETVLRICERRLNLGVPKGTYEERMKRIDEAAKADVPRLVAIVDGLSRRYVELKADAPERKGLETELQSNDTLIRMHRRGLVALITFILYRHFRGHADSVSICLELDGFLKPPSVRQIVTRAVGIWKQARKTCRECGTEFMPTQYGRQKYCGKACIRKVKARRERAKRARLRLEGLCGPCRQRKREQLHKVNFVSQFSTA